MALPVDTKRVITCFLIACVFFVGGYYLGMSRKTPCVYQVFSGSREAVHEVTHQSADFTLPQDMMQRQSSFRGLMNLLSTQRRQVQYQLNEVSKNLEYFRVKSAEAEKASSLEESLVHEVRYRDNLILLSNGERELLIVYDKAVRACEDYIAYLEGALKVR